jgi:enoyl-CoA hydratase/carnithine racemase
MLLTGSPHDAETAERYGLTTGLYATDELRGAAIALAERIASRAPMAVEATKRVAGRAVDMDPDEAGRMQAVELRVLRRSADHKEAVQAFREKRDPVFQRK